MTEFHFWILLAVYLVLVGASFVIPNDNHNEKELQPLKDLAIHKRIVISILGVAMLISGLIGFVGLFFFWPPAPYLFFGAVIARASSDYFMLGETKKRGGSAALAHGTFIYEMAMAFIVFWGPAKGLFSA